MVPCPSSVGGGGGDSGGGHDGGGGVEGESRLMDNKQLQLDLYGGPAWGRRRDNVHTKT